MNLHSRHVWHQYKTLGLCTNTKRESKSYFPSSSYSWYSSVKRVQVVVAISQPSAFAAISELSSSTTITLLFLRLAGFWGQNLNVDVDSREGEVCRRAGSTALPTSHRMRRLTAVHLFSAVRETARCHRWRAQRSFCLGRYTCNIFPFHTFFSRCVERWHHCESVNTFRNECC